MTPEQITSELSDCKTANRYLTDVRGDRFWVFGLPTGELLVRRCIDGVMKPLRTMQYDDVLTIEPTAKATKQSDAAPAYSDCVIDTPRKRVTSVKKLVKLAGELHAAYADLIAFDAETNRLVASQPITFDRRARTRLREQFSKAEDRATDRLNRAVNQSTSDRVDVAYKACGAIGYVFDGF